MRRSPLRLLAVLTVCLTVAACQETSSRSTGSSADPSSPVVARLGEEVITVADLDARILALPASQRPRPGEALDDWYAEQIRDLAIERRLLERARAEGRADDEAFQEAYRQAERQIGLRLCLAQIVPSAPPVTEADLREEWDRHPDRYSTPERRSLYQIFLRRRPGAEREIEALRDRVLNGESFLRLAAEESESETRHREGLVGWVTPGQLPAGFEKVVRELEEGVPSRPVTTRDGQHLFYVDQVMPARRLSFEEARPYLRQRVLAQHQESVLAGLDEDIDPPEGSRIPDREELARWFEEGDPDTVVLQLGDTTWTLADLRSRVAELLAREERLAARAPTFEVAWQLLDQARRREEIYRRCRTRNQIPEEVLQTALSAWREKSLVDVERRQRLVELALEDAERLRLFYDSNLGDFSTPPTWILRWLRIPLGDRPTETMDRLERAAETPGGSLDALRAELGGEIEELEAKSLAELERMQPKLPPLVAPLRSGELSPPFRSQQGLEIVQVVARSDSEPIPFEQVRDRVAARYVQQYTSELYQRLGRKVLGDDELHIDPEALARMRSAGLPEPDVSVEELEALLAQG